MALPDLTSTTTWDDPTLDLLRIAVLTEQERRRLVATGQQQAADLAASYAAAVAPVAAVTQATLPAGAVVGPGAKMTDTGGVVWINQSGAWLAPSVAGPVQYPMGWRLLNPPASAATWATGVAYKIGDLVKYQGTTYKCIQAHTSQAGWTPPAVPALWALA